MKILILHPECDPACVGWNLYSALKKYTKHDIRHIVGFPTYISNGVLMEKESDLIINGSLQNCTKDFLENLVNEADIIHFSQKDWTEKVYGNNYCIQDIMHTNKNQKIIFHGHGGAWLLDPTNQIERCKQKGAIMVTCSPIDEYVIKGIKWMPNILKFTEHLSFDSNKNFDDPLLASLSNNAPLYKGGEIAEYVFDYLRRFGYDVKFSIIKNIERDESFSIRRKHHFTIDNWTQGFFGMAGLEGMAMGHIVIARLDSLAFKKWSVEFGSLPPVENVHGMDECAKVIRKYYNDRDLLMSNSIKSNKWIKEYYSEKHLAEKWSKFYDSL